MARGRSHDDATQLLFDLWVTPPPLSRSRAVGSGETTTRSTQTAGRVLSEPEEGTADRPPRCARGAGQFIRGNRSPGVPFGFPKPGTHIIRHARHEHARRNFSSLEKLQRFGAAGLSASALALASSSTLAADAALTTVRRDDEPHSPRRIVNLEILLKAWLCVSTARTASPFVRRPGLLGSRTNSAARLYRLTPGQPCALALAESSCP